MKISRRMMWLLATVIVAIPVAVAFATPYDDMVAARDAADEASTEADSRETYWLGQYDNAVFFEEDLRCDWCEITCDTWCNYGGRSKISVGITLDQGDDWLHNHTDVGTSKKVDADHIFTGEYDPFTGLTAGVDENFDRGDVDYAAAMVHWNAGNPLDACDPEWCLAVADFDKATEHFCDSIGVLKYLEDGCACTGWTLGTVAHAIAQACEDFHYAEETITEAQEYEEN